MCLCQVLLTPEVFDTVFIAGITSDYVWLYLVWVTVSHWGPIFTPLIIYYLKHPPILWSFQISFQPIAYSPAFLLCLISENISLNQLGRKERVNRFRSEMGRAACRCGGQAGTGGSHHQSVHRPVSYCNGFSCYYVKLYHHIFQMIILYNLC